MCVCSTQQPSLRHMSQIARDIASGLTYLHETCAFLHLDLNPANVVLTRQLAVGDMDAPRAVIIDFGWGVEMGHGKGYAVVKEGRWGISDSSSHSFCLPGLNSRLAMVADLNLGRRTVLQCLRSHACCQ